ncbi:MAG: CCE_0567 family metalloprotein [Magnetospirillum sp.]
MSDIETLKAAVKKLSTQATQAKMDLHDLSEELPINWEKIPDVAAQCHDLYAKLAQARQDLKAAGG